MAYHMIMHVSRNERCNDESIQHTTRTRPLNADDRDVSWLRCVMFDAKVEILRAKVKKVKTKSANSQINNKQIPNKTKSQKNVKNENQKKHTHFHI